MSSDNAFPPNESMFPFAIGKLYLQNVYWEQVSNSRGFHQIWFSSSSQRDIEQEIAKYFHQEISKYFNQEIEKNFPPASFIFFCCELRIHAGHDFPLFKTSGNVRTKI